MYEFRWNAWNVGHIADHGVSPEEAENIVRGARPPFPREIGDEKFLVRGQSAAGHFLQVIFIVDADKALYVIHARPMTIAEKRQFRRSIR